MTVAWRSGSAGALQAQGRGFKSLRDHHRKRRKTPFQMGFFFSMALCRRIASWQNLADECPVRRVGEFRQGFSSAGFGRRIRGPVGSWADSHSWRARRVSQRAPLVAPPLSECDAALPCSLNARVRFVSPYCLLSVSRGALSRRSRGDGAPSWPPSAPQGQLPGLCVPRVRTARLPLPRPRPAARFPTTCRRGRS